MSPRRSLPLSGSQFDVLGNEDGLRDIYSIVPFSATVSPSRYGFMEEAISFHLNEHYEKENLEKLALANGVH